MENSIDKMPKSEKQVRMRYCMIHSCEYFKGTTDSRVHFYRSQCLETLQKWIEIINQYQKCVIISHVCQLHFESNCLKQNGARLQKGAVPTIFPNCISKVEENIEEDPLATTKDSISTYASPLQKLNHKEIFSTDTDQIMNSKPKLINDIQEDTLHQMEVEDMDASTSTCNNCVARELKIQKLEMEIKDLKKIVERYKNMAQYHKVASDDESEAYDPIEPMIDTFCDFNEDVVQEMLNGGSDLSQKRSQHVEQTQEKERETEEETVDVSESLKSKPSIGSDRCSNPLLKPFQCGECNECFAKPLELSEHLATHRFHLSYKCGKCHESFKEGRELSKHLKSHEESLQQSHDKCEKSIVCRSKDKMAETLCASKKHKIKKVKTRPIFECYICKVSFDSIKQVRAHLKIHDKCEKCFICYENMTKDQMAEHLCVTEEQDMKCDYCEQRFISTKNLLNHLKSHNVGIKMHKCLGCPMYFKMEILRNHHQECLEKNHNMPFACDKCSRIYESQEALNTHKCQLKVDGNSTSIATHLCEHCGKSFNSAYYLSKHIKWHEEPTIKCPNCPKLFGTFGHLKRHSYIHRNVKFICSICARELASPIGLENHMLSHDNSSAAYGECDICFKKIKKTYLKNHIRSHKRQGRFDCAYCSKSFKYGGDLNRHLRIHLGDEMYKCDYDQCEKRFKYPLDLRKHSFEHYKEEQTNALINENQEMA